MNILQAIEKRRSTRSLAPVRITDEILTELMRAAQLAPSCYNNQPWRFVFVTDQNQLGRIFGTLSPGNEWAVDASLVVAVFSSKELDCIVKNREYYLFDTGLATAFLLLRATELGLATHPIAGFKEKKVKDILGIPEKMVLITLIIVSQQADTINPKLSTELKKIEEVRPTRFALEKIGFRDRYGA